MCRVLYAAGEKVFTKVTNEVIAEHLDEIADLLVAHAANGFRIRAYRRAADTLRGLTTSVSSIFAERGIGGLCALPGIGQSIAHTVINLLRTGRTPLLDRLRGETDAERAFATVPTIGPALARRIHDALGIETLGELEVAALNGRLSHIPGIGAKRLRAVRESLSGRFRLSLPQSPRQRQQSEPRVAEILDIDREYRHLAELDRLPKITPRKFNPAHDAWLPILHTTRGRRHYTALYSNTARAHELGTTHDWVVIFRDDDAGHGQWTVITSQIGSLKGWRIVRGRETECAEHYHSECSI